MSICDNTTVNQETLLKLQSIGKKTCRNAYKKKLLMTLELDRVSRYRYSVPVTVLKRYRGTLVHATAHHWACLLFAPHTAGENLIKPAAVEMARILCDDAVANKLAMIPLSNDITSGVFKNYQKIFCNKLLLLYSAVESFVPNWMRQQISEMMHSSWCSCDTLTQTTIWSSFLFYRPLAKNTTGDQIFKKVDSFFKEHKLEWSDCVSVCEDGAPSMMGYKKGFMSFVKKENKNISVVHCLYHRENLAAKEIQEDLTIVFKQVVSVVNFIKSRPLHTRLFHVLCDEMGTEHNGFLFHSNIRWLSRGKVLERVANLQNEIKRLFKGTET